MSFQDIKLIILNFSNPFFLLRHLHETVAQNYYCNVVYTNIISCLLYGNVDLILDKKYYNHQRQTFQRK